MHVCMYVRMCICMCVYIYVSPTLKIHMLSTNVVRKKEECKSSSAGFPVIR